MTALTRTRGPPEPCGSRWCVGKVNSGRSPPERRLVALKAAVHLAGPWEKHFLSPAGTISHFQMRSEKFCGVGALQTGQGARCRGISPCFLPFLGCCNILDVPTVPHVDECGWLDESLCLYESVF